MMRKDQQRIRARLLAWIDALPPPLFPHMQRGAYWRIYKLLPFIAGISFILIATVELAWFQVDLVFLIITAIWELGVFFLIAQFMVSGK